MPVAPAWTTPASLRQDLLRRWERGLYWEGWFTDSTQFPLRIRLTGPSSQEWSQQFDAVRAWAQHYASQEQSLAFTLEWKELEHRIVGRNRVPAYATFADLTTLAAFLHRKSELEHFAYNAAALLQAFPALQNWLKEFPREALRDSASWCQCITLAQWMRAHPQPGIYLRQIPLPGMDTKFVQAHQGLLRTWLAPDNADTPRLSFATQFGYLDKPALVRIRILDETQYLQGFSDLTLLSDELAKWQHGITTWIVIENDITALAMPPLPRTAILYGRGYGFEALRTISWLQQVRLYYWGDLDTHGFAILDQFRASFPQAHSLLMDRATLLCHQPQWVLETKPTQAVLTHLATQESVLYNELVDNKFGATIRLEQERIGFDWIQKYLSALY